MEIVSIVFIVPIILLRQSLSSLQNCLNDNGATIPSLIVCTVSIVLQQRCVKILLQNAFSASTKKEHGINSVLTSSKLHFVKSWTLLVFKTFCKVFWVELLLYSNFWKCYIIIPKHYIIVSNVYLHILHLWSQNWHF